MKPIFFFFFTNSTIISLLSTAGKILARVILNCLISAVSEESLPESQCGFRPGRSTHRHGGFSVRQIQEKCIEQRMDFYAGLHRPHKGLRHGEQRSTVGHSLQNLVAPENLLTSSASSTMAWLAMFLWGVTPLPPLKSRMASNRAVSLPPVLFNLFFTCVLNHALQDLDRGIYIKYRIEWLSVRPTPAQGQDQNKLRDSWQRRCLLDDCALMAHTEVDLQLIVSKFAEASQLFGLTISLGKTEVL